MCRGRMLRSETLVLVKGEWRWVVEGRATERGVQWSYDHGEIWENLVKRAGGVISE